MEYNEKLYTFIYIVHTKAIITEFQIVYNYLK